MNTWQGMANTHVALGSPVLWKKHNSGRTLETEWVVQVPVHMGSWVNAPRLGSGGSLGRQLWRPHSLAQPCRRQEFPATSYPSAMEPAKAGVRRSFATVTSHWGLEEESWFHKKCSHGTQRNHRGCTSNEVSAWRSTERVSLAASPTQGQKGHGPTIFPFCLLLLPSLFYCPSTVPESCALLITLSESFDMDPDSEKDTTSFT